MFCSVGYKRMSMWLSFHIFYSGSFDRLIVHLSSNLLLPSYRQGLVTKFFYVRYHELGPHMRLRLLPANGCKEMVTATMLTVIKQFLEEHPANRSALEQRFAPSITAQWYPEGTIQVIDYIPETERYGGDTSITFCETHFTCSSRVVAQLIRATLTIATGKRLLYASILAVHFAKHCVQEQAVSFYNSYYQEWLVTALQITGLKAESSLLAQFETAYTAQKGTLDALFGQAEEVTLGDTIDDALHIWDDANKELAFHLRQCALSHTRLMSVMRSVLHMTFNRLGIRNEEECYIAWIMAQYLSVNKN
jgi:thiopeptide-type bacteriocin biosynthesis protein